METGLFEFNKQQMGYTKTGTGPAVVLLHGFGEDHHIFNGTVTILEKTYAVYTPDLIFTGMSQFNATTPITNFSIEYLADSIAALIEYEKIETCILLGHSMGGYIGLSFADYYVNHVQGLLLLHSTTYEDNEAKKLSRMKVAEFIQEWGVSKFFESATPNLFGDAFKKTNPGTIQNLIESGLGIGQEAMIQFVFAMRNRKAMTHLLQQSNLPVWMIAGDADLAVPIQDSLEQIKLLPSPNSLVLKEVGHMGMLEATDQVNQFIHQCIQSA